MKEKKSELESLGWICSKCACPSGQGFDCANKDFRGFLVLLRPKLFKILNKGHVIQAGHHYQLKENLVKNGLTKDNQQDIQKK